MQQEEMKHDIGKFVLTKSFRNKPVDIPKKFLFAFIELGHPSEVCKKVESEEEIAEEPMDVIFRVLDDNRLACRKVNTTEMLDKRLERSSKVFPVQRRSQRKIAGRLLIFFLESEDSLRLSSA